MSTLRRFIVWAESPQMVQRWRFVRVAAGVVAASGIVDQLANGTATRAGVVAVVVGVLEVSYHRSTKA